MEEQKKKPIILGILLILLGGIFIYLPTTAPTYSAQEYIATMFGGSLILSGIFIAMGKIVGAYISVLIPIIAVTSSYIATDGDLKQVAIKSIFWIILSAYIFSPKVRGNLA